MPHTMSVMVPGTKTPGSEDVIRVGPEGWEWVKRAIPCPVTPRTFRRRWEQARAAVGAPHARLHDLKHCLGQWSTDAGMSEAKVQVFMRHKNPDMTRRYTKQRDRGDVAQMMDELLFGSLPQAEERGA